MHFNFSQVLGAGAGAIQGIIFRGIGTWHRLALWT